MSDFADLLVTGNGVICESGNSLPQENPRVTHTAEGALPDPAEQEGREQGRVQKTTMGGSETGAAGRPRFSTLHS